MFSTLARSGLEPVAVEARAVVLLRAALTDIAACQGSVSVFFWFPESLPFCVTQPVVLFLSVLLAPWYLDIQVHSSFSPSLCMLRVYLYHIYLFQIWSRDINLHPSHFLSSSLFLLLFFYFVCLSL